MAPTTHAAKARREELAKLIAHLAPEKKVDDLLPWAEKLVEDQKYASSIERSDVVSHFRGIVEKLRVVSRLELSDALESRVNQLESIVQDSRMFSVLQTASMLLDIPNDPLRAPHTLDLDSHRIPKPEPTLTWQDIVGDEPFSGEHWELDLRSDNGSETDQVEGEEASDESDDDDGQIELDIDRTYEPLPRPIESYVLESPEAAAVKSDIVGESYWVDPSQFISESNVIRECLFALLGYPNELFESAVTAGLFEVAPVYGWIMAHSTPQALHGLLTRIGRYATLLSQLREFSDAYFVNENFPKFDCNHIFGTLDKFVQRITNQLLALQEELLDDESTVSLLALTAQVADIVEPYAPLVQVILTVAQTAGYTRVELLNRLFEAITLAEVSSEDASLSILVEAYTAVFDNYPLQLWITRGVSQDADFFITAAVAKARSIATLSWNEVRRSTSRHPPLPSMMSEEMADLIFEAGKASMLLSDAEENVRFVWRPLQFHSSEEFINLLSAQIREARNSNILQLSNYIFENCGLGAVLKLYRDIYFLHDTSGAMPRFVSYINEHDVDRHSAVDALEEAFSGRRPPVNVSAITGSGNVVLMVPLKNELLSCLFDRSAIATYNSVFSVLVKLSRWHSRAKHDHGWDPIVFSQALSFTDMMIRSKVEQFSRAIAENRETQNIFEAHNMFLADIERSMPTIGRYEQSGLLSDFVDEVSKKLGVKF